MGKEHGMPLEIITRQNGKTWGTKCYQEKQFGGNLDRGITIYVHWGNGSKVY